MPCLLAEVFLLSIPSMFYKAVKRLSDQKLDQMERMLIELIHAVGSMKALFEEEREENQRRFEQIDRRFEQIDRRFEQIDRRFGQIDGRFEQIDRHFGQVDGRFEQMEDRFERLEARFDKRFDELSEQMEDIKKDQRYMMTKIFENELEIQKIKDGLILSARNKTRQDR